MVSVAEQFCVLIWAFKGSNSFVNWEHHEQALNLEGHSTCQFKNTGANNPPLEMVMNMTYSRFLFINKVTIHLSEKSSKYFGE